MTFMDYINSANKPTKNQLCRKSFRKARAQCVVQQPVVSPILSFSEAVDRSLIDEITRTVILTPAPPGTIFNYYAPVCVGGCVR